MVSHWFVSLALTISLCAVSAAPVQALTKEEIESKLPDNSAVAKMAKSIVGMSYIDSLRAAAANFRDYQCYCQLFTRKENKWKDYGGAVFFFKQQELLRAEIKSSDYRNGSVIVKQSDGKIRGKGGGTLSLVKMTIQPDSRSIRLPTGFSLAKSDFMSLYDALKDQMNDGAEATVSAPVAIAPFKEPVLVLMLRKKGSIDTGIVHVVYLNPKTKIPLAWNTFQDGESHAFVSFNDLDVNKGLPDDLFHL